MKPHSLLAESHPSETEVESAIQHLVMLLPVARHIIDCLVCRARLTEALRSISELSGPALWEKHGLSKRTANALSRAGVVTLDALLRRKPEEIQGIGTVSAREIRHLLERAGVASGS
jgi:DNA-directed RNA polymerase alpha subunit